MALAGKAPYISVQDPAVDTEREGFAELWRLYQDGQGEAPLKEGLTPVTYWLKPLGHRGKSYVKHVGDVGGENLAVLTVAGLCIERAEGLIGKDGKAIELQRVRIDGFFTVTEECLEQIDAGTLYELGLEAWRRSNLNPL